MEGEIPKGVRLGVRLDLRVIMSCRRKRPLKKKNLNPKPINPKSKTLNVTFGLALGLRVSKVSTVRDRGAWSRNAVTFGLAFGLRVSKVSTVTGIGGSWSRSAEMSLLDLRLIFTSQECEQSQGSGGPGREAQKCHCWTCV